MLAASRALFKSKNGIAWILGTGSNCAYFDGVRNHEITYSTGYLLGDSGSGYDLGISPHGIFIEVDFPWRRPVWMKLLHLWYPHCSKSF